jgi:hypothetical protein
MVCALIKADLSRPFPIQLSSCTEYTSRMNPFRKKMQLIHARAQCRLLVQFLCVIYSLFNC